MTTTADILSFLAGRGFTEAAEAVAAQFPTGQPEGGWRPTQQEFLRLMMEAGYDAAKVHPAAYFNFSWTTLHNAILARLDRPFDVHDFGDAIDPNASHNRRRLAPPSPIPSSDAEQQ